ncbi:ABC transporter permease [Tropicimonas isoalkanivorans]|uniref:Ribose transport system permease protein n=1 Tax=Tropicimonas isoalkanivorans TaxID=441112 RepID=A0A1I1DSB1_9RHOB|nr:ABC transporter permease [Tropicimonas isoalkanivorans]SFB77919.1 ribose transport system permease protein [Tropicimonas isoalkanivorans]
MKLKNIGFSTMQIGIVAIVLAALIAVSSLVSEYFASSYNMMIIARSLAFIGLVTTGQAMLMLLGELDISLGTIGGLCGVIAGMLMVNLGLNPFVSMLLAVMFGALFGLFNGLLVTGLGLHSLVLTIAMAGVYKGINLVLTKGVAITNIPEQVQFLGRGQVWGIPVPFIIMLVIALLITVIAHKSPFGRYIFAIGDNPPAARMLGIKTNRIRIMVFTLAGTLAALAGTLMVARLGTAQPSIGDSWVLPSIAAAVIGGVATTGGVGSPLGAILGAGIIGVIENIIVLYGVSPYWQGVISGVVVVLAISFDSISRRFLFGRH